MQDLILTSIPIEQLKSEITQSIGQELKRQLKLLTPTTEITEFISKKEAAKLLGVSLPTILQWVKQGKIKGYRIASRVRFKRSEIEASLISIKTGSAHAQN